MLLCNGSKITTWSLFENTRELSGVFKDSSRFIRMLLCPNHMAMSQAATLAQGERTPSCRIKGIYHPPRGAKSSQPKASPLALPLPTPPWLDAASLGGFSASFGRAWNFPQTTARSLQCISLSSYLLSCWQHVGDERATGTLRVTARHLPITRLCLISPWQGVADAFVFVYHAIAGTQGKKEEEMVVESSLVQRRQQAVIGEPWQQHQTGQGEPSHRRNGSPGTRHWACCPPQPQSQPLPCSEATEPPASVLWHKLGCYSPSRENAAPWQFQFYTLAHLQTRFSLFLGV